MPPTGAKGLNLAASDVRHSLSCADRAVQDELEYSLDTVFRNGRWRGSGRPNASPWQMTPASASRTDASGFDRKLQAAGLQYLFKSTAAQTALAENYLGCPIEKSR